MNFQIIKTEVSKDSLPDSACNSIREEDSTTDSNYWSPAALKGPSQVLFVCFLWSQIFKLKQLTSKKIKNQNLSRIICGVFFKQY